jgi:GTP cyclohydrolase II
MKDDKPCEEARDPQQREPKPCTVRNIVQIPLDGFEKPASFISFHDVSDNREHLAIGLGDWQNVEIPLVRLHSECLTGDVFASQKCDCGPQLDEAMQRIYQHGGLMLYLRQEGRGIGLYNKLDAYQLQAEGQNTYEANNHLGFGEDLRNYTAAAQMLKALKTERLYLLSNNADKQQQLEENGITVLERRNTSVHCNVHNKPYLSAKADLAGHDIIL